MSTPVDDADPSFGRRPRSTSAETRARVLEAAAIAFSDAAYEHVSMRDLATRAGTDAAIIVRLFGSKEALFREVAATAFGSKAAFDGPAARMGEAIADLLLSPAKAHPGGGEFDAFRFLLGSASSPVAAPIVAEAFHTQAVGPLAEHLGGEDAEGRAALVLACVIGLTTMRFALRSPALDGPGGPALRERFAAAVQACID